LKTRVKKICEGFRGTLYPCPEAPTDRREMAMGVMTRIEDLNTVRTPLTIDLFFMSMSHEKLKTTILCPRLGAE